MLLTRTGSPIKDGTGTTLLGSRRAFPVNTCVVAEGDSITSHPSAYPTKLDWLYRKTNAVAGSTLAIMSARAAALDAAYPGSGLGFSRYILTVLIGANDLSGYSSAAQWAADYAAYLDARKSAGWSKIVACTVLPRNDSTHNTRLATVNPLILGFAAGGHADATADFANDASVGNVSNVNSTLYYIDGLHPTEYSHRSLAAIMRASIEPLIV